VNRVDAMWPFGRYTMGALAAAATRMRSYGKERIPQSGGFIIALNHVSWIDIPLFGFSNPRNTYYIAKAEAHALPGIGPFIRSFGSFGVRRGESDREAVRRMREVVREGNCLGVFVEGTRQPSNELGPIQPGAAMVAMKEKVPIVCGAIYGSKEWKVGNFARCTIAWGNPWRTGDLSRDEVNEKIAAELQKQLDWLRAVHESGRRPLHATPPR